MAQGEGFKHITVTAADEEDVVIMAGATAVPDSVEASVSDNAKEEPAGMLPEDLLPVDGDDVDEPAGTLPERPRSQEHTSQVADMANDDDAEKIVQPKRKPQDNYRETTLEDLESTSMPLTQKIVIIAAIVCIIGAVIYYFAFMG